MAVAFRQPSIDILVYVSICYVGSVMVNKVLSSSTRSSVRSDPIIKINPFWRSGSRSPYTTPIAVIRCVLASARLV